MALAALATVADCTARGLTIDPTETAVMGTYLDVASTAVREAAGAPISQTTSTLTLEGGTSPFLALPGPPVQSVSEVLLDGAPVTGWKLRSHSLHRPAGWGWEAEVTVTYTHGLPDVPADIVDLVCRIAASTLVAYRSEGGGAGLAAQDVRQERIGDYSVTYGDDGRITEMELPEYLRERLAARFGGGISLLRSR